MNYSITDFINSKSNNAYNFLKLTEIIYQKEKNNCIISFIYPEIINLTQTDFDKITTLAKEFLSISAEVEVKIKKSYLDVDLIEKFIKNYFDKNHLSISQSFNDNTLKIKRDGEAINIEFFIDSFVKDYFFKKGIVSTLTDKLEQCFCGKFFIKISEVSIDDNLNHNFIEKRAARLEEISIATAYVSIKKRFKINIIKKLIGDPIVIDPEHITLKEAIGVVLAGKMKNLTAKTFKSKKAIKNEKGETVQEEKPYFNFDLIDGNVSIKAVYFPNKSTYHKMNLLLQDGDIFVAIKGDIEKFNDKFSLRVKDLSTCEIPTGSDISNDADYKQESEEYNFIAPVVYEDLKQTDIFKTKTNINENVKGKKFVVFDLETTGMDAAKCEILEIGAVKIDNGRIVETFSCFVKPKGHIPDDSTQIHGITDEMVANAYAINQILPDFYKFTRGCILIAHNIDFDMSFISFNAKKLGYKFDNEQIDTLALSRAKLPTLRSHKLSNVCASLGITLTGAHRAVNDTLATAQVFLKLY